MPSFLRHTQRSRTWVFNIISKTAAAVGAILFFCESQTCPGNILLLWYLLKNIELIKIVTGTLMFIQQEQQKTLQFHSIPPITPTAQLKRQSYLSQVLWKICSSPAHKISFVCYSLFGPKKYPLKQNFTVSSVLC